VRRLAPVFPLALLLAGAVALGGGPTSTRQQQVGLLAVGDFGVGGSRQRTLGDAMRRFEARNPADTVVTLGDNDYTASPTAFRANWAAAFDWLEAAGVSVAGTLGNHDVAVQRGRYEFQTLGMPGPFYRRRVGDVELFVLDSNAPTWDQTRWLHRALAASKARWKIAVLHHPPFSCGAYHGHPLVGKRWVPLFERYRVRLVLSGHDHNYQRFAARRGVTYVVHGGGSGYFYPLSACPRGYPSRPRARPEKGFLYIVARADRLDGYALNMAGRRTDSFTLRP
jgi:tartrate-resistant acid phosphatase type 5